MKGVNKVKEGSIFHMKPGLKKTHSLKPGHDKPKAPVHHGE